MLDASYRFVKLLQDLCMLFLSFLCMFFKQIFKQIQIWLGLGPKTLGQGGGKITDSVKITILERSFVGLWLLCLHDQASEEDECLCQISWQSIKTVVEIIQSEAKRWIKSPTLPPLNP